MGTFETSMKLSRDIEYCSDRWNPDRLKRIYKQLEQLTEELIINSPQVYKEDYIKIRDDIGKVK